MLTAEKKVWKTPNGGDYSIVYYFDNDGNDADKSVATNCLCVEYDKNGETVHSQRRYIVRRTNDLDSSTSIEEAVKIAIKHCRPKLKLLDWCFDIGDAYAFAAASADGTKLFAGMMVVINKSNGARHEEQYLPETKFARLVNNGKRIDISQYTQNEGEKPEVALIH